MAMQKIDNNFISRAELYLPTEKYHEPIGHTARFKKVVIFVKSADIYLHASFYSFVAYRLL